MLKKQVENRLMSRGELKIQMNIHEIFNKLGSLDFFKAFNTQLKEVSVLNTTKIGQKEVRTLYMRFHGIWPVEDRDFVNVDIR